MSGPGLRDNGGRERWRSLARKPLFLAPATRSDLAEDDGGRRRRGRRCDRRPPQAALAAFLVHSLSYAGLNSLPRPRGGVACRSGGHAIWWSVEAASEEDALRLLPAYVAARTTATRVSKVKIP